ncbi:ATP-binding cassette sub-family C member 8 [Strongyloides ratti]|uniref:ATP-binding cassette sub-family C member 8 n=1 Tax=Strongyloides ratti TaxID=34506 RepID=A0A090KUY8_STRRB|nr:ATP-binding cassette sub-family C member 8 [Strongyloides ratti]CEF61191.1 ATP-binding cassette sub-family C member 8 [Strongyloides ratti]
MVNSFFCDENFFANNDSIHSKHVPVIDECYRRTVISWIPAIFFWLLAPVFIIYSERIRKRGTSISLLWTKILIVKFCLTLILIILSCIQLIYSLIHKYPISRIYSIIWIITFVGLILSQYLSKIRGIRTSGILFNTWVLFTISCLPELYYIFYNTSKTINFSSIIFIIQFIFIFSQTLLFSFADKGGEKFETGYISPELYSSFLSRLTLWWFNTFAWLGSKGNLEIDDLYDLNYGNKCEYIEKLWEKYWTPTLKKYYDDVLKNQNKKKVPLPSVVFQILRMFKYEFMTAGLIKICSDILQFINPFLLKLMIDFVSDPKSSLWLGIFYGMLMFTVSEIRSFCINFYFYIMFRLGTKIQTTLTSAVYKKTLKLSNVARRDKTVGEIVNIMAIDIERFQLITSQIQQFWSSPFQIILALIFLFNTLGYAAIAGSIVMFAFVPINYFSSVLIRKHQIAQMKYKDERVKMCNEVLNGMKVVKLYAWEIPMSKIIEDIREKELECIKKASVIKSFMDTFNQSSSFFVALFTFTTYTLSDQNSHFLTPQVAFVSLTLFNLMRSPVTMLGMLINETVRVVVSNKRLKEFLTADELDEKAINYTKNSFDGNNKCPDVGSISIKKATFSWEHDRNNLENISFNVKSGKLVVIVGKVGSGKSSLLSGILGEMTKISGEVEINGSVAYFSQQPWIQNLSLKDNILFGEEYKSQFYDKVIECCALKPDIAILPNGDKTEIGEKGINLSGGQKARISLARAVYSNSDIYLFDDPLSAVDSHVGKHIFEKVLGPSGILKNKTRVLVTNNVHLLDKADLIIMMENNKIKTMGEYDTLINDKTGILNNFIMTVEEEETKEEEDKEYTSQSIELDSDDLSEIEEITTLSLISSRTSSIISRKSTQPINEIKNNGTLINKEHADTGSVKKTVYFKYFKATKYYFAFMFIFGYLIYNGLQLGRSLWLSAWSDDYDIIANNGTINPSGTTLGVRLGVYASFGVMESLGFVFSLLALIFGGLSASRNLHSPVLYNIMRSPMSFFDTTPIGRILNRFGKDIDVIDINLPMSFRYFVMCICQILVSIVIIVITTPIFASAIPPLLFIYGFSLKLYVPTSRQLKRLESVNRSPIYSHFGETIQGASTIRGFGKIMRFIQTSNAKLDRFIKIKYLSLCANRWVAIRLEFIGNCILLFTVIFSTISKELGWITSAGLIAVSITYSMNITEVLNFAVRQISELETNIVSVERLIEYCNTETDPEWRNDEGAKYCSTNWPNKGEIIFSNYSTRYRKDLDLVVKNINIHINGGEKIGIVGRTGAGKSSLTLALFRMIEPADGTIIIDNVDITKIGLHDLRSHITVIPQDPVLFSGTLRFNLNPFNIYSDEEIWSSLEKAHLKNFALSNAEGLDFIVSEGGSNISVGTCQLICLARAILRKSKILILDEATAAIDYHTDQLIQNTIRKEFSSSTVLAIAHRLNTILDYDKIIVLDKGQVVEFDTPSNLLKDKNSTFYSMAQDAKLKEV